MLAVIGGSRTIPAPVGNPGGVATQLHITTQPGGAVTGVALTTQPVVEIRDVNNVKVTGATNAVTVEVLTGTSTISGTLTVNAVAGVATFTNLVLTGVDNVTLRFTATSLTSRTSDSLAVSSTTWTNEPPGFTRLADTAWNQSIPTGSGDQLVTGDSPWHVIYNGSDPTNTTSGAYQITDGTAPLDSGACLRFRYRNGMPAGSAPATFYFGAGGNYRYIYIGFYFKTSDPFQNASSNTRKLIFMLTANNKDFYIRLKSADGGSINWVIDIVPESFPAGNLSAYTGNISNPNVSLAVWHKFETLMKWSATESSADGILKWWLDGTLLGSYNNINYPNSPLGEPHLSPTLGGTGGSISETDTLDINHIVISQGG